MRRKGCLRLGIVIMVILACGSLGCKAQHASQPTQPTKKEVQTDSDRFFDRLQKEEQDRKE